MKRTESLWRISITTTPEAEDAVSELLGKLTGKTPSSHFQVEPQVCVVSVFGGPKQFAARGVRRRISDGLKRIQDCGLKLGAGKITIARVRREDWAESWKRHFKPIEIETALLIKPSWIKHRPRKHQAVVVLDPGLSFGTGQHATTSFCLREIVRFQRIGKKPSFLDIGTGSGILAIAAAKLGFQPVQAFDFDPESIRVARANAKVNRVGRKLQIARADIRKLLTKPSRKFDLVCANLISNLLVAERRRLVAQMHRDGILVLAGILKSEFEQVEAAFRDLGLVLVAARTEKEWRSGSFQFSQRGD